MKIVELEDQGQGFLRFYLDKHGVITHTEPFQGWLWNGRRVLQKKIEVGTRLRLGKDGEKPRVIEIPRCRHQPHPGGAIITMIAKHDGVRCTRCGSRNTVHTFTARFRKPGGSARRIHCFMCDYRFWIASSVVQRRIRKLEKVKAR